MSHFVKFTNSLQYKHFVSIEINYELSVIAPIRMRLSQEVGDVFAGRISGSLTLVKGQQLCVNTTVILEVGIDYNTLYFNDV